MIFLIIGILIVLFVWCLSITLMFLGFKNYSDSLIDKMFRLSSIVIVTVLFFGAAISAVLELVK